MKTKPITPILTLLFCLSGSVFAEEEFSYKPFDDLLSIETKGSAISAKLMEISILLFEKTNETKSVEKQFQFKTDYEYLDLIQEQKLKIKNDINNLAKLIIYERGILEHNVKSDGFIKFHNQQRKQRFDFLNTFLDERVKKIKRHQLEIKNTTAVNAINHFLRYCENVKNYVKR